MNFIDVSGLRERYENSGWYKIGIQFALIMLASAYTSLAIQGGSPELAALQSGLSTAEIKENSPLLIIWLSSVFLFRGFLYDQRSLAWGLLAGILWLSVGDVAAAGVWAASMFFMLYVICHLKTLSWIYLWYLALLIIILFDYNTIYEGIQHYVYIWGFTALFAVSVFFSIGKAARNTSDSAETEPLPEKKGLQNEASPSAPSEVPPPVREDKKVSGDDILAMLETYTELPEPVQTELNGIIKYARLIQQCMNEDPNDVKPGGEFLERYLPYTLRLLDEGNKLASQLDLHDASDEINRQGLESLHALHSAFRQKHAQLLENDALAFSTDLSLLDSLLKTDGFK
jgi:hypothetical protein